MKIRDIVMREDDAMKIKAVSGNDVTLDQGGQEIKTTADALAPGQQPGSFSMKPTDPNALKPGAVVTSDAPVTEEDEDDIELDSGIHKETDPDLMGSGHNGDVGGDATDDYIDDVVDKEWERQVDGGQGVVPQRQHQSHERPMMSKSVSEEFDSWMRIAGIK